MPLYRVSSEDGQTRLVNATSAIAALRHVATPLFDVDLISDPTKAAEMASSGIKLETAAIEAKGDHATPEKAAGAAMLNELLDKGGTPKVQANG